jgi:hypothetical protein
MSKPNPPKKMVVFTIGGKGGVGKSWLVSLLTDWYRARKIPFRAIDLDNENSTFSRFYPEADYVDITSPQELDAMIDGIIQNDAAVTLIDMRAASTDRLDPWLKKTDFIEALREEYGIAFTAVGVVDSSADSVSNIGYWARDVLGGGKAFQFVIAQNQVRGEELSYTDSKERAEYAKTFKPAEIVIPKLEDWLHRELEKADLTVGAAVESKGAKSPLTTFMNRTRLKRYQAAVFAEFDKIKDRLAPQKP